MTLIGVYGASGFGREVMPLVREQMRVAGQPCEVVFVDDGADGSGSNGHRVLTYPQFLAEPAADKRLCFAIANSQVRESWQRAPSATASRAWRCAGPTPSCWTPWKSAPARCSVRS